MKNTGRQLKDIASQANRILNYDVSLEEVKNFAKYSVELKNYLIANSEDELVLKLAREIPDLETELGRKSAFEVVTDVVVSLFASSFSYSETRQINKAKPIIREIQGKYASIEFVLK